MMDNTPSREEDLKSPKQPKIVDKQAPKRRKVVHKHVVRVRIEANVGKQKSDGPPPDSWSWRKYGQKPIKGSPFPRKGYYRCSTSKGCSAKKQVEKCKTDAAVLIITYTSKHSHPGPDLPFISPTKTLVQTKSDQHDPSTISCGPDLSSATASLQCSQDNEDISQQNAMKQVAPDNDQGNLSIQFDEGGPLPAPHMMSLPPTPPKSSQENENDFFDELEELPISSSLTSLVRSCFFDERILLPS